MPIRQQRRRLLWSDDSTNSATDAATATAPTARRSTGPAETYTAQARRDEQPRLTDLIPTRYRTLALLYASGLILLAVLEGLYFHIDALAAHVEREALGAFDLAGRGSFAAWYSSLLLSATGLVAALLFSLRRHRIDDYRGRYRMWPWVTLGLLALAINQTADLDAIVRELVELVAGRIGIAQPWVWPALCLTVAVLCLLRFSFEVRRSRGTLILGWLGAIEWLLALTGLGSLAPEQPAARVMLACGLKLLGQLTILAAHIIYARYVFLDAHGLLKSKASAGARRPRKSTDGATETAAARSAPARTDLDPPSVTPLQPAAQASGIRPAASSTLGKLAPQAEDDSDDEDESDDKSAGYAGLTRAERKRMRRERKVERRNAA